MNRWTWHCASGLADSSLVALPILPQHRRLIYASRITTCGVTARRKRRPIWHGTAFCGVSAQRQTAGGMAAVAR